MLAEQAPGIHFTDVHQQLSGKRLIATDKAPQAGDQLVVRDTTHIIQTNHLVRHRPP
jgi:hypothetical protein